MISEGLCDTEDWRKGWWNSDLHHINKNITNLLKGCVCIIYIYIYTHTYIQGAICMGGFPPSGLFIPASAELVLTPVGIKRSREAALTFRSHWSLDLNQLICDMESDWRASKQWIILRRNVFTDLEFQKAPLCSLLAFSISFIRCLNSCGNEIITMYRPKCLQCFY